MMKIILPLILLVSLTSCLRTRSELSQLDQDAVYAQKNADNQIEAQEQSPEAQSAPAVEDTDTLIRSLNGRVEVLEKQLATMQQEKENSVSENTQKINLMQEALTNMQTQLEKLENQVAENSKIAESAFKSSDDLGSDKAGNAKKSKPYPAAEQFFKKREWKKAIISYQKYTDETPHGKHVAEAKYKIGVCFQELGMKEEAMAFYEEVVANYSKTDAGKKSKTRLKKLKK